MNGISILDIFDIVNNEDSKQFEFTPKVDGYTSYTVSYSEADNVEDACISVWKNLKELLAKSEPVKPVEDAQELWDEFSEYLGESVYDAERLVGQSILRKSAFDKLAARLSSLPPAPVEVETNPVLKWVLSVLEENLSAAKSGLVDEDKARPVEDVVIETYEDLIAIFSKNKGYE